jgi:NADPH:quinone reductase-like Zn-dependent oxidoreductase
VLTVLFFLHFFVCIPGSKTENLDIGPILMKRLQVLGSTLRSRDKEYHARLRTAFEQEVLPAILDGRVKVVIDSVFSWNQIADGHKRMEDAGNVGKMIATVD